MPVVDDVRDALLELENLIENQVIYDGEREGRIYPKLTWTQHELLEFIRDFRRRRK
jgi:hypothetical protein